jgi:hypothetical protein
MPNWVFNSLVVSGEKEALDRMVTQLNQPFTMHHPVHKFVDGKYTKVADSEDYNNPVFAFWNIVKPTDLKSYYEQEVFTKKSLEPDEFMAEFVRSMNEDQDWYHWNCRNWGTKWDVAVSNDNEYPNTELEWVADDEVLIRFQTAWSPVHEVLTKLSEQHPTLEFEYEYEEEQGWGGSATFKAGQEVASGEYDIPSSHSEHRDLDRSCNCEHDLDPAYWYEDCPVDTTKYQWVDEEWQEMSDLSDTLVSTNNLQGE